MWPDREVDHSPPSSAEVKNEWSCISTPFICLHGMDRDNFTSFFTFKVITFHLWNISKIQIFTFFSSKMETGKFLILWNTEDKCCVKVCISAVGLYILLFFGFLMC
jgi:hypothetical protein